LERGTHGSNGFPRISSNQRALSVILKEVIIRALVLVLIFQAFLKTTSSQILSDSGENCIDLHEYNHIMTVIAGPEIKSEGISSCQVCRYGLLIDATTGLADSVDIEQTCGIYTDSLAAIALQRFQYQPIPNHYPNATSYYISLPFYFKRGEITLLWDDLQSFCRETQTKQMQRATEWHGNLEGSFGEPPGPKGGFKAIQNCLPELERFREKGIEKVIIATFIDPDGRAGPYKLVGAIINGQRIEYKSREPDIELRELAQLVFRAMRCVEWRPGTMWGVPIPLWVAIPVFVR